MPRILLAIDGSKESLQAAKRAAELGGSDADYVMVSVVRPLSVFAALGVGDDFEPPGGQPVPAPAQGANVLMPFAPTPEHAAAVSQSMRDHYAEAQREAELFAGLTADKRIEEAAHRHRKIGKVICEVAEEEGADAIVLGANGSHSAGEALLGSVTSYVVHHASCPVVVVPASR